jgi:polyribonucleotide nucleotidyltransferase
MHILDKMNKALNTSRTQMSDYVPKIFSFKISPDKIKEVIGKGGSTIKTIIEETGATIDISENGTVQIAAPDAKSGEAARKRVQDLAIEPEIGKIYQGKVIRIETYGAFVNILPSKDGLVHISQIAEHRVSNVTDELQEGQMVSVKLTEIDNQGRLKLSIKAAKLEEPAKVHES